MGRYPKLSKGILARLCSEAGFHADIFEYVNISWAFMFDSTGSKIQKYAVVEVELETNGWSYKVNTGCSGGFTQAPVSYQHFRS